MKRTAVAVAIVICTAMVLVASTPLVAGDTHHIVKGGQGPKHSAVTWTFTPEWNGVTSWYIVNSGLRSLVIDVEDVSIGAQIMHQKIRFASYPTNVVDTNDVVVMKGRLYQVTATPNGPEGSYADMEDMFVANPPITPPDFTYAVRGATVHVEGTCPDGQLTIVGWIWNWGDGSPESSGNFTWHTYSVFGTYTIVMTATDESGHTYSASHDVQIDNYAPVAVFTLTMDGMTAMVDASASYDLGGTIVSYEWSWGDGTTGEGVTATHTYSEGVYYIVLTVTDDMGAMDAAISTRIELSTTPLAHFWLAIHQEDWDTVHADGTPSYSPNGIVLYEWDFGDGGTATGIKADHTYAESGMYLVKLTVTDGIGLQDSTQGWINIYPR